MKPLIERQQRYAEPLVGKSTYIAGVHKKHGVYIDAIGSADDTFQKDIWKTALCKYKDKKYTMLGRVNNILQVTSDGTFCSLIMDGEDDLRRSTIPHGIMSYDKRFYLYVYFPNWTFEWSTVRVDEPCEYVLDTDFDREYLGWCFQAKIERILNTDSHGVFAKVKDSRYCRVNDEVEKGDKAKSGRRFSFR